MPLHGLTVDHEVCLRMEPIFSSGGSSLTPTLPYFDVQCTATQLCGLHNSLAGAAARLVLEDHRQWSARSQAKQRQASSTGGASSAQDRESLPNFGRTSQLGRLSPDKGVSHFCLLVSFCKHHVQSQLGDRGVLIQDFKLQRNSYQSSASEAKTDGSGDVSSLLMQSALAVVVSSGTRSVNLRRTVTHNKGDANCEPNTLEYPISRLTNRFMPGAPPGLGGIAQVLP